MDVVCDVLVVGATTSEGTARLAGGLQDLEDAFDGGLSELGDLGFKGKVGETLVLPTLGRVAAKAVAVVGLGDAGSLDASILRRAAGSAARKLSSHAEVVSALHKAIANDPRAEVAAVEGFLLGGYLFSGYKKEPKTSKVQRLALVDAEASNVERATAVSEGVVLARDLTNEPPSVLTPSALARRAEEIADVSGLQAHVFGPEELEKGAFGGILGVSKGSRRSPRLIHLIYKPEAPAGKVALVGKGITFDSGGLSLKDAKSMETMKTDMAGAAAVLGVMSCLTRLDLPVEVHAFVPTSENMPGGDAIRPGDVITHRGGRTTEVMNTDAEGRLVLGDAIAYAGEHDFDAIVDVATLTGAIMVALGRKASGVFSNDDDLREEIVRAGKSAGERMWPMPLYQDYISDLDSEVADLKNSGARWGGSIIAALFLERFVPEGTPWAHLDIAGAARAESDYDEVVKGGSGAATRTLIEWLEGRGR